jgi:dienelactone hydrolase
VNVQNQIADDDDTLNDFGRIEYTHGDDTKLVYRSGTGPAVIVMTEMPGITPHVARFARWVRDAGFTVWMPSLFGRDGATASRELAIESLQAGCIRREFEAFKNGERSPMARWLRRLAVRAHAECGGPGVGAIGMCFTGNFALTMMLEPSVLAAVMSQPSLPLDDPSGTFVSADEMARVRRRLDAEDLTVLAYRFAGDTFCQAARFDALARGLGDRFVARVLPDSAAAPGGWVGVPHSVLTTHLIDEAGQPTIAARDEILAYFANRLRPI